MEVDSQEYREFQRFKIIPNLSVLNDRIKLFESKYNMSFAEFATYVHEQSENFEYWDDYIEWLACIESRKDLLSKLDELLHD